MLVEPITTLPFVPSLDECECECEFYFIIITIIIIISQKSMGRNGILSHPLVFIDTRNITNYTWY